MSQHKEMQHWKKRKVEVEIAIKALMLKREKTLYLYEMEKQSRRKARELQLRTLLQYETKELQQAQAGLRSINEKIKGFETEQQKYAIVKIVGLILLFAVLFTFAGVFIYQENMITSESSAEEIAKISWTEALGSRFFAFLKKYDGGDNLLTGAVISVPNGPDGNCHEEQNCINETITNCINETKQKCDAACVNETIKTCAEECNPKCHIEEINGIEREICIKTCSEVCTEETVENCGNCVEVVEEKCNSEIVEQCNTKIVCDDLVEDNDATGGAAADAVEEAVQNYTSASMEGTPIENISENNSDNSIFIPILEPIIKAIFPEDLQIMAITRLVLNTTYITQGNGNVNLTAYTTGTDQKYIYNWLRNGTSIAVLNMPF
ncbi:MAG: hypothetical protein AABY40_00540, partial [Nanoarchaeota archaeon]